MPDQKGKKEVGWEKLWIRCLLFGDLISLTALLCNCKTLFADPAACSPLPITMVLSLRYITISQTHNFSLHLGSAGDCLRATFPWATSLVCHSHRKFLQSCPTCNKTHTSCALTSQASSRTRGKVVLGESCVREEYLAVWAGLSPGPEGPTPEGSLLPQQCNLP